MYLFWTGPKYFGTDQKHLFTTEFHILNQVKKIWSCPKKFRPIQNNFGQILIKQKDKAQNALFKFSCKSLFHPCFSQKLSQAPKRSQVRQKLFSQFFLKIKIILKIKSNTIIFQIFENKLPDLAVNLLEAKTSKFLPIFLEQAESSIPKKKKEIFILFFSLLFIMDSHQISS